jgi:hypothetical protein
MGSIPSLHNFAMNATKLELQNGTRDGCLELVGLQGISTCVLTDYNNEATPHSNTAFLLCQTPANVLKKGMLRLADVLSVVSLAVSLAILLWWHDFLIKLCYSTVPSSYRLCQR